MADDVEQPQVTDETVDFDSFPYRNIAHMLARARAGIEKKLVTPDATVTLQLSFTQADAVEAGLSRDDYLAAIGLVIEQQFPKWRDRLLFVLNIPPPKGPPTPKMPVQSKPVEDA